MVNFPITSSILILIMFGSFYVPLLSDMQAGNINHIQLFVITMYIACSNSRKPALVLLSGIVLGIGIMLKPNIFMIFVLSIILTLVNKEFRRFFHLLLGCSLSAVICFLISSMYFGRFSIWMDFLQSLPITLNFIYPLEDGNISLTSLIFYLTKIKASFVIFGIIFSTFLYISWISKNTKFSSYREIEAIQEYDKEYVLKEIFSTTGVGCAIMLLSAGLAWLHYYVLLIPLIIFMIRPIREKNNGEKNFMAIRLLAFIVTLLFTTISSSMVGYIALRQSILFNIATVLLLVITFYELWYQCDRTFNRNHATRTMPYRSIRTASPVAYLPVSSNVMAMFLLAAMYTEIQVF